VEYPIPAFEPGDRVHRAIAALGRRLESRAAEVMQVLHSECLTRLKSMLAARGWANPIEPWVVYYLPPELPLPKSARSSGKTGCLLTAPRVRRALAADEPFQALIRELDPMVEQVIRGAARGP
jgi:hypothetical protein